MTGAAGFDALHPAVQFQIVNHYQWPGLRPVQGMAVAPILRGDNVVILAPTAGGKTEASFFPLVSRALFEGWQGLSILYISPIRALLNNQRDRLETFMGLLGRRAATWHGDVPASAKKRLREEPPELLLTTPESLEAMLVSTKTAKAALFGNLRAVVIDEVHAFADADRGWHLLGVLDRLARYAGHDLQRIGLSATVGNRTEIVDWLSYGSAHGRATVDPPRPAGAPQPEVTLDWVASLRNAAQVIARLHPGEKRLVFCDSRKQAEQLTRELRARDITTHVTHSSLSADQRALTERQFAEGREGVIVATSALELGIDIGDLDRVIQIDAPWSVASFLQRMGRTGRRSGTVPNCLFLAITDDGLVRGAAILDAWARGEVEPAEAPGAPWHVFAQQVLALALERPGLTADDAIDRTRALRDGGALADADARDVIDHLIATGYLFADGARLGVGRVGEAKLGHRHFMELLSVFTTPPLFTVMQGPREIGQVSATTFDPDEEVQQILLLAGRTWRVGTIDWRRNIAYVEPFDAPGRVKFAGSGPGMSPLLAVAHRRVLLGSETATGHWSARARTAMDAHIEGHAFLFDDGVTLDIHDRSFTAWTFAGQKANRTLAHAFTHAGFTKTVATGLVVRGTSPSMHVTEAVEEALATWRRDGLPPIELDSDDALIRGLKFARLLPPAQAVDAVVARAYDIEPQSQPLRSWRSSRRTD